jgi:hypothetical protein
MLWFNLVDYLCCVRAVCGLCRYEHLLMPLCNCEAELCCVSRHSGLLADEFGSLSSATNRLLSLTRRIVLAQIAACHFRCVFSGVFAANNATAHTLWQLSRQHWCNGAVVRIYHQGIKFARPFTIGVAFETNSFRDNCRVLFVSWNAMLSVPWFSRGCLRLSIWW